MQIRLIALIAIIANTSLYAASDKTPPLIQVHVDNIDPHSHFIGDYFQWRKNELPGLAAGECGMLIAANLELSQYRDDWRLRTVPQQIVHAMPSQLLSVRLDDPEAPEKYKDLISLAVAEVKQNLIAMASAGGLVLHMQTPRITAFVFALAYNGMVLKAHVKADIGSNTPLPLVSTDDFIMVDSPVVLEIVHDELSIHEIQHQETEYKEC
jgi:hypothetical protein